MSKTLRWIVFGGLALAGVATLILLAGRQATKRGEQTVEVLGPLIRAAILSPFPGVEAPTGTPLIVEATGFAEAPLAGLQLWADGSLVDAAMPSAEQDPTNLHVDFAWVPAEPGPHVLLARAMDVNGASAESAPLIVNALMTEQLSEGKTGVDDSAPTGMGGGSEGAMGGDVPAAGPLDSPPAGPGPDDDIAPAELLDLSLINLIEAPAGPPAAPDLVVETEGCASILTLHDLSANEDGFRLYRLTPAAPTWKLVETLAGQSEADFLTYTDPGIPGTAMYKVSAFNSEGQAYSNLASVQVDPAGCPDEGPALEKLFINLTGLESDIPADLAYCYASLGGIQWIRLPTAGFFEPGPNGFEISQGLAAVALDVLGESGPPMDSLDLNCWGWLGGALTHLGDLHLDPEGLGSLGPIELVDGGLAAHLDVFVDEPAKPLGWDGDLPNPYSIGGDPNMPYVFALVTYNVENCKEHMPSGGSNLLENLLFCTPYPEFGFDDQPYLTWWIIEGVCPAGKGSDCFTLEQLQQVADESGGSLGFTLYDCEEGGGLCYLHYFPFDLTAWPVPPFTSCDTERGLTVQLSWFGPDGDDVMSGPGSPPFVLQNPCPPAYETAGYVDLDVAFDDLVLDDLDDNDSGAEDAEIYGYFKTFTTGDYGGYLLLGEWSSSDVHCIGNEVDFPVYLQTMGTGVGCPTVVQDGTYDLAEFALCPSTEKYFCYLWPQDVETDWLTNSNHLILRVHEGEAVTLGVKLIDFDDGSDHDGTCSAVYTTKGRTLDEWSQVHGTWTLVQGDNGNGSCQVHIQLNAVGP